MLPLVDRYLVLVSTVLISGEEGAGGGGVGGGETNCCKE